MEKVILFDGVCNLCNGAVNFVIRKDKKQVFRFASLQSNAAKDLLKPFASRSAGADSMLLLENNHLYNKSAAALRVARRLPFPWPLLYGFMIVPRFIRDKVYDIVAKNRYKWFGKREQCMVPREQLRARFLEQ
jgi:predicted DCC family thiol-disulfide oxidoreductase YuxK